MKNRKNSATPAFFMLAILLLFSLPAHAQTAISQASMVWYQSSASLTVPAGQNLACVVDAQVQGGTGAPTLSDSTNDHWTLAAQVGEAVLQAAWYAIPCSPGVHVLNVSRATTAPAYRFLNALAYSGVGSFDTAGIAAGQSTFANPSLATAQAGELLVASFTESGPLNPTEVLDSSFTLRLSTYWQQLVSADKVAGAAGPYSGSLTFQPPFTVTPSWTAILLAFKPPAPSIPPQPDSVHVLGELLWCSLCFDPNTVNPDGTVKLGAANHTTDTPATGNLVITQTGGAQATFPIAADGTVVASGTIDLAQDPIELTFMLTDATGTPQPGATLMTRIPNWEAKAALVSGTIFFGVIRNKHITDAGGNPAAQFVDLSNVSLR